MQSPVLFKGHFQNAYVADDASEVMEAFGRLYGVSNWHVMDAAASPGERSPIGRLCTAWVGETMFEIIQPNHDVESIYQNWGKGAPGRVRFHHLGFLLNSAEDFTAAREKYVDDGFPVAMEGIFGDILQYAYLDTVSYLGHYCELIHLLPAGKTYFDRVPSNG